MKNKVYSIEKKAGIWINHTCAHVYQLNDNFQYELKTFFSEPEQSQEEQGGKKHSRFKRMFMNQARIQRREHQKMLKFFDLITHQIRDINYLYLFGPGSSKHELSNFVEKAGKKFSIKVMAVDAADKMTPAQMLEQVKNYFRSLSFEDSQRQLLSTEH
ncbi:hypothetical protein WG906_07800 [Pedobacter sp. P351]|uniref:hypothetical protein n=1 Tax=Pedobacter superstes TaxID=3133441 RepID=UPI0030B45DE7